MAASAQSAAGAADSTRTPPSAMRARGEFTPNGRAVLMTAPGGATIATLDSAARLQVLGRARGWMRVRLDGWVRDADVRLADSSGYSALSAADLRAAPNGARGKTVRWRVQVIALQTADPLRRDLAPNEPYLLARGPGGEDALLYLAIPPSLLDAARALDPLSTVTVVARVRVGRSEPSGVPILDIERIVQR
jgi:hypothetical protein